jgi:type 1 glutamine amidotransferase
VGRGRVVYDALGHDERALSHESHRRLLRRAALWSLGRPYAEVENS